MKKILKLKVAVFPDGSSVNVKDALIGIVVLTLLTFALNG